MHTHRFAQTKKPYSEYGLYCNQRTIGRLPVLKNRKNSLSDYMKSLYGIPTLTKDEERELAKKIAEGDPHAFDKMVKHNLRFEIGRAHV